jgi:hypothetical protein
MTKQQDRVTFTQSRMLDFLTCERLEWFKFQAGTGVGVEIISRPDFFLEGEFMHYALMQWYKTGSKVSACACAGKNKKCPACKGEGSVQGTPLMLRENMLKRIKEMMDELGPIEQQDMLRKQSKLAAMLGAAQAYKQLYRSDFDRWDILAVEKEFEFPLGDVLIRGKMDLVVRDRESNKVGFIEHKALQSFDGSDFSNLPINLQQLLYSRGCEVALSLRPEWYMWNVIKKSSLRLKQNESLVEFETRTQQQYTEDPAKMFVRPPPRMIEQKAVESTLSDMTQHIERWVTLRNSNAIPPMRWCSCEGKYSNACSFGPACTALQCGKKEGWNAAECKGLYRVKEQLHPELEGK